MDLRYQAGLLFLTGPPRTSLSAPVEMVPGVGAGDFSHTARGLAGAQCACRLRLAPLVHTYHVLRCCFETPMFGCVRCIEEGRILRPLGEVRKAQTQPRMESSHSLRRSLLGHLYNSWILQHVMHHIFNNCAVPHLSVISKAHRGQQLNNKAVILDFTCNTPKRNTPHGDLSVWIRSSNSIVGGSSVVLRTTRTIQP